MRNTDLFDIDNVPEEERKKTAQEVAETVLADLKEAQILKVLHNGNYSYIRWWPVLFIF